MALHKKNLEAESHEPALEGDVVAFSRHPRSKVKRMPKRGSAERAQIYAILERISFAISAMSSRASPM